MGEVYRATDAKLGREVALKVLPPDMARDSERLARFQREARALAALNHPHIVTIYSVEESDGVHFLTMELLEGQSLDHRTDIFSLGIILYEMSTGWRPFAGTSSAELASAILRDTPPLVTDVRANLPADLARIIQRCLEKSAADRFQSARDIRNELRGINTANAEASPPSSTTPTGSRPATTPDSGAARAEEGFWVAVLPFKYGSGNAELTALSEGITEDIVTGLSRFSYLKVISQSSTSRFAKAAVDVRSAGKELGARYLLEGSIRQAPRRVADMLTSYGLCWSPSLVPPLQLSFSSKLIARANDSSRVVSEFVRTQKGKLDSPRRVRLDLPLPMKAS
jgi:serine/threonine protein kinase